MKLYYTIILLVALGIFFTVKQFGSKSNLIAAVCAVFSVIILGLATNFIYDEISKPTSSDTTQPVTQNEVTPQPPGTVPTSGQNVTPPVSTTQPKPVEKVSLLNTETYYSDGLVYYKDDIIDNEGNQYIGYATMESGKVLVDYDGEAVYQNKNYSRFTGRVITSKRFKNCDDCGWIRVYGDEELIFDSGKMEKGISPKDFDLDISAYAEIKIEFKDGLYTTHETDYDYAVARCFLVNSYFHY